MKTDSLSQRIEIIIGLCSSDDIPNPGKIVLLLKELLPDLESFEADLNIPDLQTENAALKAAFETVKSDFKTEKQRMNSELEAHKANCAAQTNILSSQLDGANKEIKRLQADQAERHYQETTDLKEKIQWAVIDLLNPPELSKLSTPKICGSIKMFMADPALQSREIIQHLKKLKELGLIDFSLNAANGEMWFLTDKGNTLAISKGKTDESGQTPKRKFPDLPAMEEEILLMLVGTSKNTDNIHDTYNPTGMRPICTKAKTEFILESLEKKGFIYSKLRATYGAGSGMFWSLENLGSQYLDERGKL